MEASVYFYGQTGRSHKDIGFTSHSSDAHVTSSAMRVMEREGGSEAGQAGWTVGVDSRSGPGAAQDSAACSILAPLSCPPTLLGPMRNLSKA